MKIIHASALVLVALAGVNSKSWYASDTPGVFELLPRTYFSMTPDLSHSRIHQVEQETAADLARAA